MRKQVICVIPIMGFKKDALYDFDTVGACTYFGGKRDESWVYNSGNSPALIDFKDYPDNFKLFEGLKPRWKVGDYIVYENQYIKYEKVIELCGEGGLFTYNGIPECYLRDPTQEELDLYYR